MQKLLLTVVMVVACASMVIGGRGKGKNQAEKDLRQCKWTFEPCVLSEGAVCGKGQKLGKSVEETCPVKEKLFKCKVPCGVTGCQYKPVKTTTKPECTRGTKLEIIETLVSGDPTKCAETRTVFKNCHRRDTRQTKGGRRGGSGKSKVTTTLAPAEPEAQDEMEGEVVPAAVEKGACKYQRKGQKSECDPTTKMMTVTMQLKKKSPSTCAPTKTVTKPCSKRMKNPNRRNPKNLI